MTYESVFQSIMDLPVFDTHTHLETGWRQSTKGLYARSFFDICFNFFFTIRFGFSGGWLFDFLFLGLAQSKLGWGRQLFLIAAC